MTRDVSESDSSSWTESADATMVPPMVQASSGSGSRTAVFQRIGYGILALAVLLTIFQLDVLIAETAAQREGPWSELLRRGSVVPLFFVLVFFCATIELGRLLHGQAVRPHLKFAQAMIAVLLLTPWLSAAGWLGSEPPQLEGFYWEIIALAATVIGGGLLAIARRNPDGALRDLGATFLIVFYLGFLGSFGVQLRCGRDIPDQEGAWLLLVVILLIKVSDIGAYFVGSAFGRHKLMPTISPAKSIEGAIGGLAASAATAMLIANASSPLSFALIHHPEGLSPLVRAAIFGLAMSATGQMGDLLESCFKRDADAKDSGKVIPRFGGILDLIDSPVLAMPVGWFLLTQVWGIV